MRLWQTRRHWEKLARTDPFWAVLSSPEKKGNRWTAAEFFAAGREEVATIMASVQRRAPGLRHGHALDFGCGVGRLSQGLADHFERVTGVDIAAPMLELAREHNRHGDRVDYRHNTRPDLALFADHTFDFVCSIITLQHIAPEYSRRYLVEFVRVLAPGGVALFQIPTAVAPPERWRHSFWPPTLATRLRRFTFRFLNRSAAFQPVMGMNAIPPDEVGALIVAAGAELLDRYRYDATGSDVESLAYLVRKPATPSPA